MAIVAMVGPLMPVTNSIARPISTNCSVPTGCIRASDINRQLPRQNTMDISILRNGDCRLRRSLSMPHRIAPTPQHNTMTPAMTPALPSPIA
ncbi:hypothetical protein D3C72_2012570 [compost metagenome]